MTNSMTPMMRAKLIFNPASGSANDSPVQLMDVINEMQAWKIIPEAYLTEPDGDPSPVVQDAIRRGIRMFVVCGGDGTVESVATALAGTQATLGIIPTGTRNNVALSLGIPKGITESVKLLRTGRRVKVDMGRAVSAERSCLFIETCSIGLFAALYPSADEIQHGNLGRIGDFLAALFAFPATKLRLVMDKQPAISLHGHVVLVSNFPYVGPNYQVAHVSSFNDGHLHVQVFAEQSKLETLNTIAAGDGVEDPRILRYHVKHVEIETDPPVPAMADGCALGEGPLRIEVWRRALAVIAGELESSKDTGRD